MNIVIFINFVVLIVLSAKQWLFRIWLMSLKTCEIVSKYYNLNVWLSQSSLALIEKHSSKEIIWRANVVYNCRTLRKLLTQVLLF